MRPPKVDRYGYGFRAPAMLVSAYAKRGHIESTTLDFTSALKFIETNWGVAPLADRDRNSKTFLSAFDFAKPPREPEFVSATRAGPPEKQPVRAVVYIAYGLAVFLAAVAIAAALGSERLGGRGIAARRSKRRKKVPA